MPTKSVQEVARQVQRLFGDTAEAQIFVNDIIDWVNAAQLEIVRQTECLQGIQTLDTSINDPTNGLTLPSDFLKEKRIVYGTGTANSGPLQRTTFDELDGLRIAVTPAQTDSFPLYYYIWNNAVFLWPDPQSVGVGYYNLYYIRTPTEVTSSGDLLSVPYQMYDDVIRFCLMRAKELNEDEQGVNRINAELQQKFAQSRDEAMNPSDSYPVVRDYPGDFWTYN